MNQQSDVVSLVNISGQKWPPRHRAYFGSLMIQSPGPGEAYAVTPIRGCTSVMDLGDKRPMEIRLSAREIAEDLERELNGDSGEGSFHGVFIAAGPAPTDVELADTRKKLEEFQARLVEAADLAWERSHNLMFITDLERRAASELRLEKPWLYDRKPTAIARHAGRRSSQEWGSAGLAGPFSTGRRRRSLDWSRGKRRARRRGEPRRRRQHSYPPQSEKHFKGIMSAIGSVDAPIELFGELVTDILSCWIRLASFNEEHSQEMAVPPPAGYLRKACQTRAARLAHPLRQPDSTLRRGSRDKQRKAMKPKEIARHSVV